MEVLFGAASYSLLGRPASLIIGRAEGPFLVGCAGRWSRGFANFEHLYLLQLDRCYASL